MLHDTADPKPTLVLPVHHQVCFVLVAPHYPENVGAAARAIKTMGFTRLVIVRPGRLARPDHEMALKMAVKSRDVLDQARVVDSLVEALDGAEHVVATTSRRGVSGVLSPRVLCPTVVGWAERGERTALVFGNEKTGLDAAQVSRAHLCVRIPMAGDQPSINLAQATQVIAYELLVAALERRARPE